MVTLRWKLGPRGSECAWSQAGAVSSSRQGHHLLYYSVLPLSLEMGRLARAQEDTSEPGLDHGVPYVPNV